ncbi:MAG TPA: condensation domain-containing protein, partial [Longimicrobiaceae bacterium]|nr:condensation domain-containing protein [Longimicrobiaceae bacterium]
SRGAGESPRGLRRAFVGGDRVPAELLDEMRGAFPAAETQVLYGPTEATVLATAYRVPGEGETGGHRIGAPLGGVRLYVCDAAGSPLPPGVPGELWIGGAGVARGYLGRPDLTAERFVPDPFSGRSGARLYRTGDRVRWRADGGMEFLGRTDAQVKIRGFRIEPGEVEAALLRRPGVREAAVVAREDAPGEERLVGYVAPAAGEGLDPAELRAHLRGELPEYMVPSALVVLDALPLTPTGKTDRHALPAPEAASAEVYTAPRTPAEERLAGIFAEVLKRERVGAHDDFFALGGHSLLATRVVSRVREAFGVELPLRALFEAPTVAALAERVASAPPAQGDPAGGGALSPTSRLLLRERLSGWEGRPASPDGIRRVPRDRPLPLSFAQQRLWFVEQLDPGNPTYNMPFPLRLRGALDTGALERALSEIVRRHEVLRTVFGEVDGEAVQIILPLRGLPLPEIDLRGLAGPAREAEMQRLADRDAMRPFDLRRGPLLRATLLRIGEEDRGVLLNVHHIVADGWSTGLLVGELSTLYRTFAEGRPSPLPEPQVQYADFAAWQREWLTGARLEEQLAYWRHRLAGAPPTLDLPTDHPRPAAPSARGATRHFHLSVEDSRAVRALCLREGVTPFMAFLAAWQLLLARYSGEEELSVGTAIAGRNRVELEGLIGFFVNTLVLRAELVGRPSGREVLWRVREATLGAFAHQDVPFDRLVEELAP